MRNIGIEVKNPDKECEDVNCPFHGKLPVRGQILEGTVISDKAHKTVVVLRTNLKKIRKYERFEPRRSKISAHNPPCINAKVGDVVSEKKNVKRGGSYYESSSTPAPSPKKENEVAVPHLTPIVTPIPTVTPTVTPILTLIPSSTPEPSPTPSPAVSPTPAALIPGSEFLFAMISIIIAVCLFRHRK
ncbi:MAG TPA: 30S ribosomal protein S17 [Methanophagales archaeon]|nr:30S ribosomal protein S17 [Methanophagales archaeon]